MPYDDQLSIDAENEIRILRRKLRNYNNTLDIINGNLAECRTVIVESQRSETVPVLDENDNPVLDENEKPTFETRTIPAVTKPPENKRTYQPFTDAERTKQQSAALAELVKLKVEVDKLS